jgi:hypothetical protein
MEEVQAMSTGIQMPPDSNTTDAMDATKGVLIDRIIGGVVLAAAVLLLVLVGYDTGVTLIFLAGPLLVGAVVAVIGRNELTARIDSWESGFQRQLEQARSATGKFARWFKRPFFGGLSLWWKATQGIPFLHLRAGLRIAGLLYFGGLMIYVLFAVIMLIIMGVVFWFAAWCAGLWNRGDEPSLPDRTIKSSPAKRKGPIDPVPPLPNIGRTVRLEGITGPYWVHYDKDGNKVAESRLMEGISGPYIEHRDATGNKIGETRDIDGVFGPYAKHTDVHHEKTAESRVYDGVFQPYTKTVDEHGEKIRESHESGILTPTIEHKVERKG